MQISKHGEKTQIDIPILDAYAATILAFAYYEDEMNQKILICSSLIGDEYFIRLIDDNTEYKISQEEYMVLKKYLKSLKNYKPTVEELLKPRKIINPIFELEI